MAADSSKTSKSANPQRERSAYLGERIRVLQAEIRALRDEKRTVATSLKGIADKKSPEAKRLKSRRVYVSKRPEEAKAELSEAMSERKSLVESLKAAG